MPKFRREDETEETEVDEQGRRLFREDEPTAEPAEGSADDDSGDDDDTEVEEQRRYSDATLKRDLSAIASPLSRLR